MNREPELNFFCELGAEELRDLFDDRFVYDDLKSLKAGVSLGILDFSEERVQVVRNLNKLGIPVTAWLLLPKEEGYWFNQDNYKAAIARYEAFKDWTRRKELKWACVGLDIEPDFGQMQAAAGGDMTVVRGAFKRLREKKNFTAAKNAYARLVAQIRDDGYRTESYHIPLIIDDRKAHATVLQRLAGLVDLDVDREVLMLYSSFVRPQGQAMLWQYGQDADAVAIGVTGGGVEMDGVAARAPLTWEEFCTDLRIAYRLNKPLYVFSLEGCVTQGFLGRLITFDWEETVKAPKSGLVKTGRFVLTLGLWMTQRPFAALLGLSGIVGGIALLKGRKKKNIKLQR